MTIRRVAPLYLLLSLSLPGAAAGEVVRIHDLAPGQLATLRAAYDFWGVDWRENYAVFNLDAAQRRELEQAGLEITPDRRRSRELTAWRAATEQASQQRGSDTIPGFACYRTVDATHAALADLAAEFPNRASWIDIGDTWQAGAGSAAGDSIFALVLRNADSPHPKAPLVVMAAQHARELATAEIATRLAELLLENPDDDPDIAWLLDHREIHIIAQANPDGRRQVENGAALWRKNHNESACPSGNLGSTWPGIDLNRNSSFFWGEFSSDNACSQSYRGSVPASEPETQVVQNYFDSVFDVQRPASDLDTPAPADARGVFISLHSFSEMVLFPWEGLGGGNENNAPNHDGLAILGRRFGFLNDYAVGRWQLLGPAGGTSVDFAYGEFGVAAYTFEVGTSFTQPCASFENTVWPDNRDALLLAAKAARLPYLAPAGPEVTALDTSFSGGALRLFGSADDTRFFRGDVAEPPADPVSNVVEVRVSPNLPEQLANVTWVFPVNAPANQISFDITLPPSLPGSGKLFVTAVDDTGQVGLPRVAYSDLIHANGFEAGTP